MTIVCPRYFSVAVASARITWSVEPPAGQGTIKVTGREGKLWAKAPDIASDAAARTNHFRRRGMRSSAIVGAIGEYTAGRPKLPGRLPLADAMSRLAPRAPRKLHAARRVVVDNVYFARDFQVLPAAVRPRAPPFLRCFPPFTISRLDLRPSRGLVPSFILLQDYQDGIRHREVVQRREGLRLCHARGRREGPVRAFQRDSATRVQVAAGRPARDVRRHDGPQGPAGSEHPPRGLSFRARAATT